VIHTASVTLAGDPARAFDLAATVLASNGFRLEKRDDRTLAAVGRGMQSTKQNPLTGAGRVTLTRVGSELRLEADLGGVRRLVRFLVALPVGLAVAFLVGWALSGGARGPLPWQPALALAPWLVISPLMVFWIRRRTIAALDDLLASLATHAGRR